MERYCDKDIMGAITSTSLHPPKTPVSMKPLVDFTSFYIIKCCCMSKQSSINNNYFLKLILSRQVKVRRRVYVYQTCSVLIIRRDFPAAAVNLQL